MICGDGYKDCMQCLHDLSHSLMTQQVNLKAEKRNGCLFSCYQFQLLYLMVQRVERMAIVNKSRK